MMSFDLSLSSTYLQRMGSMIALMAQFAGNHPWILIRAWHKCSTSSHDLPIWTNRIIRLWKDTPKISWHDCINHLLVWFNTKALGTIMDLHIYTSLPQHWPFVNYFFRDYVSLHTCILACLDKHTLEHLEHHNFNIPLQLQKAITTSQNNDIFRKQYQIHKKITTSQNKYNFRKQKTFSVLASSVSDHNFLRLIIKHVLVRLSGHISLHALTNIHPGMP